MSDQPQQLVSIGHLCQHFQRGYFDVFRELTERGVKPALVLDLCPYFDFGEAYRALEATSATPPAQTNRRAPARRPRNREAGCPKME